MANRFSRGVCRHCGAEAVTRPRGLGWRCYYTPGVRQLYPSDSPYAFRGFGNLMGEPRLPAEPTGAPPGSLAKMRVMRRRAAAGESLFHPLDEAVPVRELCDPFVALGPAVYGGADPLG